MSIETPKLSNYFEDFTLWTKIHYYAIKNRKFYPNLFFFHFPFSGVLVKEMTEDERQKIFTFMSIHKSKINGMWGYLSLLLDNKNGIEIYYTINQTEFFESSISFPCFQERGCDFDKGLKDKSEKILSDNNNKYELILQNFEKYLDECDKEKQNEFHTFENNNKNIILFAYDQKDLITLIKEKISKKEIEGNGIIIEKKENEKNNKMEIDDSCYDKSTQNKTPKKKLKKKKKFFESDSSEGENEIESVNNSKIIHTPVKGSNLFNNEIDYLEHEQKIDGYASDYTKRIYYKEHLDYFSEDENIKIKNQRKKKYHRVKIKGKTVINNTELNHKRDKYNIGINVELENNYDKLKKALLAHKKFRSKRKLNKGKNEQRISSHKKGKKKKNDQEEAKVNGPSKKKLMTDEYYYYSSSKKKSNLMLNINNKISNKNTGTINDNNSDNKSNSSINSLLNGNFPKEKKKIKRNKTKYSLDNIKNQKIQTFMPIINNLKVSKEKTIIRNINKLINNEKFEDIFSIFENEKEKYESLSQKIKATIQHLISNSNDIDQEILSSIQIDSGEYKLSNDLIINQISTTDTNVINLFKFYKEKIIQFFNIISNSSQEENEEKFIISLKTSEHLLKIVIQQISPNTTNNIFLTALINIISDMMKTFLQILVEYILKGSNDIDDTSTKSFSLLVYTFLAINFVVVQKFNNEQIKNLTIKFIKIFNFILLVKIYSYSNKELLSITNDDAVGIISLFYLFSENYFEITQKSKKNFLYEMIKVLFNEYLYINNDIETQRIGDLNEIILNDLSKYLAPTVTCLFQDKFEEGMKVNLKKFFLYKSFQLDNLSDISLDLKKVIRNRILLMLFHRYYITFFLFSIDLGLVETSFLLYFMEILNKCYSQTTINENYYDIEYLSRLISEMNQFKIPFEKNLMYKYLLNDSKLLLLLDYNWSIDSQSKLKCIFSFFSILNFQNRKNNTIDSKIVTVEIFRLIPLIFNFSQVNDINEKIINSLPYLIKFIFNICLCISNSFTKSEVDEINKIKFFSRYFTFANPYKNILNERKDTNFTLNIIPVISIILNYVQFADQFTEKKHIENVIGKIKEIIDSENIRSIMKSFSLAIWINLIQKISQKKINFDISKYIDMINSNILSVIQNHNKYVSLPDCQQENNILIDENNETILNFLQNFKIISEKNPEIIFTYTNILREMKEILNIEFFYPVKFRHYVLEILECLIDKFEEKIKKEFTFEGELDFGDGNIIMACFEDEGDNFEISKEQKDFLICLRNFYFPAFDKITKFYESKNNCNISNKKKIFYQFYEKICVLQAQMYGILTKYNLFYKPFDYCVKVFKDSLYFKNNIPKGIISQNDNENFTKLPFILMVEYLRRNKNIIKNQIMNREYKSTLQYFIILFFIGAFMKNDKKFLLNHSLFKEYYQSLTQTENYCLLFLDLIKESRSQIEHSNMCLLTEIQKNNNNITERNREEATYYNLFKILASVDSKNYSSLQIMSSILDIITLEKNLDKIESKFFFGLLNNEIFINGLDKILTVINSIDEKNEVVNSMMRLKFYILGKFTTNYAIGNCDNNLRIFLDNFIKNINNDNDQLNACLRNETFMIYFNTLISKLKDDIFFFNTFIEQKKLISNVYSIILKRFEKITIEDINKNEFNIFDDKIESLISNDFYLLLYDISNQLGVVSTSNELIMYQLITFNNILTKSNSIEEIHDLFYAFLSKINMINNSITNIYGFLIYRSIINKLVQFLEMLYLTEVIPKKGLMDYIQKIVEYFIHYSFCISYSISTRSKIEKIMMTKLISQKKMINYTQEIINELKNKSDNMWVSYFLTNIHEIFNHLYIQNKYILNIFLNYRLTNSKDYENIKFLERINNHIYSKENKRRER